MRTTLKLCVLAACLILSGCYTTTYRKPKLPEPVRHEINLFFADAGLAEHEIAQWADPSKRPTLCKKVERGIAAWELREGRNFPSRPYRQYEKECRKYLTAQSNVRRM